MKLFFLKDDSLYKLFSTLEKTPKQSEVQIFIETENQFFNNTRWTKQIDAILKKRSIKAIFIAENDRQRLFFETNNINHTVKKISNKRIFINMLYRFFFNIKKFHLNNFKHQTYLSAAIFGTEFLIVLGLFYMGYSLIMPKTTIIITPAYQINEIVYNFRYMFPDDIKTYPYTDRHIIIPLYTGIISQVSKSHTLDTLQKSNPAYKIIRSNTTLFNTTNQNISLATQTQLIDQFGIEYITTSSTRIVPRIDVTTASTTNISIISKNTPENNRLIKLYEGEINIGNKLLIKNLKSSMMTQEIYLTMNQAIDLIEDTNDQFVSIQAFQKQQKALYENFFDQRKQYIAKDQIPKGGIVIPFNKFIDLKNCIYEALGDSDDIDRVKSLSGTMTCDIEYAYVQKTDIINGIKDYLNKRNNNTKTILNIQEDTITFFELIAGEYNANSVPTRIHIIESYNLQEDRNNIIPTITNQIIGKTKDEALQIIGQYPEIEKADIQISPRRYDTITTTRSRIFMEY